MSFDSSPARSLRPRSTAFRRAETCKGDFREVTVDVPGRFRAKIRCEPFYFKRGRTSRWFWHARSAWTEARAPYLVRFFGFTLAFGLAEVGRGSRMRCRARSSVGKLPVGFAGLLGVDIDDLAHLEMTVEAPVQGFGALSNFCRFADRT
jgi:hypothetical protein